MMSLEQAIEHAEDIATSAIGCECREEHRQLVEWLRELQEKRKERDYWQEKAHSYEQTIFKLTDAISKQSERAEGEWVQIQRCARDAQPDLECPFCKHRIGWFDMGRYCAKCGAKLKGGAG